MSTEAINVAWLTSDADGNAASLKRVEKLSAKRAPFQFCDLCNNADLEEVFRKVCDGFSLALLLSCASS